MNKRTAHAIAVPLMLLLPLAGGCTTDSGEGGTQGEPEQSLLRTEVQRRLARQHERVRSVETAHPAGMGVVMNTHRYRLEPHVIEWDTVETSAPERVVKTLQLAGDETVWLAPQSGSTHKVGATPARIVEVGFKANRTGISVESEPQEVTVPYPEWTPDPLDPNRDIAVLLGDPVQPGPYTVRLRLGGGYAMALHRHPSEDVHLTVLSGVLYWSSGAEGSGAPEHTAPAGSVILFPTDTPHRLWTAEPTIVQMTGTGPRAYIYLVPEK